MEYAKNLGLWWLIAIPALVVGVVVGLTHNAMSLILDGVGK